MKIRKDDIMQDSKELKAMREMALFRAIGELKSSLCTTYDREYYNKILKPNIEKAVGYIEKCF
jgi:hypothetical protein